MHSNYQQFYEDMRARIPDARLIRDPLRTLIYGTDASFYRLVPQIVVQVENEQEVIHVLQNAKRHNTPVTFRAAGTSISGQSLSDSVLVVLGHDGWRDYEISDDGSRIRLAPGIIGAQANRYLAPWYRKIGPDPASLNACMIGGIAANNSAGMCCSVKQNTYQTLISMRMVLADGTVLDTDDELSRRNFTQQHKDLLNRIDDLARSTRENAELATRIREKFRIRNTTGYSLNALVDFEDPIDILQHLLIGSEGTLGFISHITYRTLEEHPHKASALMLYPNVETACEVVTILSSQPVSAVELMDRATLRSVQDRPGMPDGLKELPDDAAALLVETRAGNHADLWQQIEQITATVGEHAALKDVRFTDVPEEYEPYWNIRRGLYPSIGAMRKTGTSVITEDIVFPVERLAPAVIDVQKLLRKYGYADAIIIGHALEGNLHVVFSQDFRSPEEISRYQQLLDDITRLVVERYGGSLKGEHGTGRNMAPFVEMEWGTQAYRLMREIKSILDPDNLLNPGVILNDDPQAHLKDLKPMPTADPLVDACIECGLCESICPSAALTFTPRQRIAGLRELTRAATLVGETSTWHQQLEESYRYYAVDTCAACGLCATACPVSIDTGLMMKTMRGREAGVIKNKAGKLLANKFSWAERATRFSMSGAGLLHSMLGTDTMEHLGDRARALSGDRLPRWNRYMPTAARYRVPANGQAIGDKPCVVYFSACSARTMGPAKGDPQGDTLPAKTAALFRKADYDVVYPDDCHNLCCGMPFESKGLTGIADDKQRECHEALMAASRNGSDPVVFDTSPCAWRMRQVSSNAPRPLDIAEFIHDHLLNRLTFHRRAETVALHSTCSTRKMGLQDKLEHITALCAENVVVPPNVSCCGWAGDKGFTTPELSASALRTLRDSLPQDCTEGYSTSRTCEIGLSCHSDRYYRSIVYLVDSCTEPKVPVGRKNSNDLYHIVIQ